MKLFAVYNTWGDWDLLLPSIKNILPVVEGVVVINSIESNYGETDLEHADGLKELFDLNELKLFIIGFNPQKSMPMNMETGKRNFGLETARALGATHYLSCDADEFYDQDEFLREKQRFIDNPDLQGLVCASRVYFGSPTLTIGLDVTLVPFIHKLTVTLKHDFNRKYPFAWEGLRIRIDPTRSFNINTGVEWSPIVLEHYSWVRRDPMKKIRNSTARANIERSSILRDLANAKPGYYCEFYKAPLVRVPAKFDIPEYGGISNEDLQSIPANSPEE